MGQGSGGIGESIDFVIDLFGNFFYERRRLYFPECFLAVTFGGLYGLRRSFNGHRYYEVLFQFQDSFSFDFCLCYCQGLSL